ncbi:PKD domain containing protein [Longispora sp. K20-0274]|uniref:PKD domain containing protein n=1 Tax=Longispora sp. K20-0274 TaxID=3088255 RepID=UPI00399ACB58
MNYRDRIAPRALTAAALAVAVLLAPCPATADLAQADVVSERPMSWTPHVLDGTVYAIAVVGDIAVVGGDFTTVRAASSGTAVRRRYVFAFRLGTGELLPDFAPTLDGTVYALSAGEDGHVYVGGAFTQVNGEDRRGLAKLDIRTGATDRAFTGTIADGEVHTLVARGDRLYVSGWFSAISGVWRTALARLDARTGEADHGFAPALTRAGGGLVRVEAMAVTRDGATLLIDGSFTQVDGFDRFNLALLDVADALPYVRDWNTDAYRNSTCIWSPSTYLRGLDFAPDGSYFVVVTSGHINEPTKLCDTAARFEAGDGTHKPTWVNHTGANTLLSVAVTGSAVYVGGHQQWLDNTYGRNKSRGPGAVPRPGIGAIDPDTGKALDWNPTKDRGVGVEALVAYPGGLLVGSDTEYMGHEYHARLGGFELP